MLFIDLLLSRKEGFHLVPQLPLVIQSLLPVDLVLEPHQPHLVGLILVLPRLVMRANLRTSRSLPVDLLLVVRLLLLQLIQNLQPVVFRLELLKPQHLLPAVSHDVLKGLDFVLTYLDLSVCFFFIISSQDFHLVALQRLLQMLKPLLLLPVVCFHMICRKNCGFILDFCSHWLTTLLINKGFSFGGTPAPAPDAKAPAPAAGGMFSYESVQYN